MILDLILIISAMMLTLLALGYVILSSPGELKRALKNLADSVEKFKATFSVEMVKTINVILNKR